MYKVKVDVEKMIGLKIKQGLILVLSATCIFTPTVYSEMEPYATAKEQFSPAALDNSGNSVNDSHVLQLNTLQDLSANAKAKIVGNRSVTDAIDKKSPLPATPNQHINNSVDYMVADLNQDGNVNDGDLGIMKSRFFASTGDSRYDVRADFNTDGVINFVDLGIFKRYYTMAQNPPMISNLNKPSTNPLQKVNKTGQSQIKTAMPNNLVPAIVPSPRLPKHNKGIVVIQNTNHSKGNIIRPSSGIQE